MVGVYDATDGFSRIGEFPTHGVGPHEMLLMPDGRTLAVANGGIETHPDFGRAKLNLPTMQPSLVFLDRENGALLESHRLPPSLHQLSIRHMAIAADGHVWFGCQHEGPQSEQPALVGVARPGEELALVDMPRDVLSGLRNYVGSVAANVEAGTVAVSSPQGNNLVILDASAGRWSRQRNWSKSAASRQRKAASSLRPGRESCWMRTGRKQAFRLCLGQPPASDRGLRAGSQRGSRAPSSA